MDATLLEIAQRVERLERGFNDMRAESKCS